MNCDRSVVFSGSSGFLHQQNRPPRCNCNIVEVAWNTIKQTNKQTNNQLSSKPNDKRDDFKFAFKTFSTLVIRVRSLYFPTDIYTPAGGEWGILFYLWPSFVCPSVRPKIFFVAFFSATIDGRNLIFGHKLHIGMPYCGKRFWIRPIPTSCLPT